MLSGIKSIIEYNNQYTFLREIKVDKSTSNKIKYVNLILAILVVYRHAVNYTYYNITSRFVYWFEIFTMNISDCANAIFFVLSAFLFYQNYDETKLKSKLKNRFSSLVIPFIIWNVIGYLYFQALALFPSLRQYYGGSITDFSFANIIMAVISTDYNIATWFLKTLIVYTFVFPFLYPVVKNKKASFALLIVSIVLNIVMLNKGDVVGCVCYYYLGMFAAINYKDIVVKRYKKTTKIIAFIVFTITIVVTSLMFSRYSNHIMPIIRIIQVISFWCMTDMLVFDSPILKLSKYTFLLYVSHSMVLEPIEKVLYIFLGDNNIWAFV